MQTKGGALVHIRDGNVSRLVVYWDPERLLSDAGRASEVGGTGETD
jgi:ketosteroid isomerase-like protein